MAQVPVGGPNVMPDITPKGIGERTDGTDSALLLVRTRVVVHAKFISAPDCIV
jgi:hypothetical protein